MEEKTFTPQDSFALLKQFCYHIQRQDLYNENDDAIKMALEVINDGRKPNHLPSDIKNFVIKAATRLVEINRKHIVISTKSISIFEKLLESVCFEKNMVLTQSDLNVIDLLSKMLTIALKGKEDRKTLEQEGSESCEPYVDTNTKSTKIEIESDNQVLLDDDNEIKMLQKTDNLKDEEIQNMLLVNGENLKNNMLPSTPTPVIHMVKQKYEMLSENTNTNPESRDEL